MRLRVLLVSVAAVLGATPAIASASGGPIMPLSEVQPGMVCTGETVIQGTTISPFTVTVVDVVQDPQQGPRILVRVSGAAVTPSGIAEGFSGSPVYCPTSSGSLANAGALSASLPEYGNDLGEVTPIQQMLGEPISPPTSALHIALRTRPLLAPLTISGLAPSLLSLAQKAAAHSGRALTAQPAGPLSTFAPQPLVPGASVSVAYSSGDIAMGAVGTVTYQNGSTVYAFGHELDGAGRRSLLLQDAYVYGVISNPAFGSFKLAAPGHDLGTLTSDTPNAVIGSVGALPALVPVSVTAHDLDDGQTVTLNAHVADETDVGLPLGASMVDAIAPLEVAQAATQIYDGPPANESGTMCLQIHVRELRLPLGFCNRYVASGTSGDAGVSPPALAALASNDVTSAFTALEQVRFANLHVTAVTAQITAQRGLAEGDLIGAQSRVHVRPGQRVTVRLRLRLVRGAVRTVTFRLRIPRHIHGLYAVTLHGPAPVALAGSPSAGGLASALTSIFSSGPGGPGGPGGPPAAPATPAALRQAIAAVGSYDGLILSSPGRHSQHVYRDPALVIAGQASLTFFVR